MAEFIWNADNGDGTYTNPILYADYSDPDAIRVGDDYFMVASSFCNAPGLPVLHSKDLVNWKVVNYVLNKIPEDRYRSPIHGCGVWAPSIRYHEGLYYVCFPMPDEGIYMSTAVDPFGEWSEPINIRPGAGWIDPCPFWDEDGKAYLVAGVAKSRIGYKSVLHIVEMSPDGSRLIGDEIKVFDGNENDQETIEGPKLYKRNGWYYIFAPAGGVKTGWQTVLRSRNIYGPYEYRVVMRQGETEVNGPHQGAWVDTVTGEDWFIHFQDVYSAGRIIHLQPMEWVDDWPIIGAHRENETCGYPVLRFRKPTVKREKAFNKSDICEPATSDDFSGGRPGLQWQWNANPEENWLSLENHAELRLNAKNKKAPYGDTPNLLLQKWPAPEFSCITVMDISELECGDEAGVISMGMEYGLVTFVVDEDFIDVRAVRGTQQFGKILVENTLEHCESIARLDKNTTQLWVKYMVERVGRQDISQSERNFPLENVTIQYSIDGVQFEDVLKMKAVPGRWVGVKNGVFCLSDKDESKGSVLVKSVSYSKIYHNPVKRGFFPDPSVVRVGEDYYMVNSTFQYFPAIAISHSTDMVNWEIIGYAVTEPDYLDLSAIKDSHGIWAPDIAYDNGRFIIMATLRLNGDGTRDNNVLRRQLMVWSERPEGPYSKPVWLEVDNIDPSLFVDDDGRHYMVISPGINLVPLSDDCSKIIGDEIAVWPGTGERCSEGPHLLKHGEYYYAMVAEGGTGYGHGINVGKSKELTGPYEPSPYNPLLRQFDADAPLQRCGHGKLIEDSNGNWWVYYLCGRPNGGKYTTIGRETALEPVTWLDDGWFVINDRKGPSTVNIAPDFMQVRIENPVEEIHKPVVPGRDDFDDEKLSDKWLFVRNPARGDYSLSERRGWLRIWTGDGQLNEIRAKNILLRREQELSYQAETVLDFNPLKDGEQAGLTCYYSTATYARFALCYEKGRKLQLVINRNHGEEIISSISDIREGKLYLRVVVDKLTRSFYYSYDNAEWIKAGVLENCIYLCDEGVPDDPKRHTGTLVGVYANNGGCGSRIPADFDYFEYKNIY